MICYACGKILTDKEIIAIPDEDFIENKGLCMYCLSISNELTNQIKREWDDRKKK